VIGQATILAMPQTGLQTALEPLPDRQQLVAMLLATGILVLVIELVRRRRLREDLSWTWVTIAAVLLVVALNDGLVVMLAGWIGAASAISTLYFSAIVVLILLALQLSVRLSRLIERHKTLAQRMALLEAELEDLRPQQARAAAEHAPAEPPQQPQILPLRTTPAIRPAKARGQQEGTA